LNSNFSDPDSGEDEEFVRSWRQNRMKELRSGIATQRRKSPSKRKYGRVETVDAAGYLDAVDKVSAETIVVVLIYSEVIPAPPPPHRRPCLAVSPNQQ
jgi:hypothetical protein